LGGEATIGTWTCIVVCEGGGIVNEEFEEDFVWVLNNVKSKRSSLSISSNGSCGFYWKIYSSWNTSIEKKNVPYFITL